MINLRQILQYLSSKLNNLNRIQTFMQQKMLKLKELQAKLASIPIPQNQEYHQMQNSQYMPKQTEQTTSNQYFSAYNPRSLHKSMSGQHLHSQLNNNHSQNSFNYRKLQSYQTKDRYQQIEPMQTAICSDQTKYQHDNRFHQLQASYHSPHLFKNTNLLNSHSNSNQNNLLSINYNSQPQIQKSVIQNPSLNKGKLKNLQNLVARISSNYQQQNMNQQYRINTYLQQIRKIQSTGKQYAQKMQQRQHNARVNLIKVQKMIKKGTDKMLKDRKDFDKKIESCLQGYLIQLSGLKSKTQSNCQSIIRQLQNLQSQVLMSEKEVQNENMMSKQVMKKVYTQFNSQIQQLSNMLNRQRKQREHQQQAILGMLQKVYNRVTTDLQEGRKMRQRNDKQVVDLLERVIEKVKVQMTRQ